MDSITHVLLGGTIALAARSPRKGRTSPVGPRAAFLLGALAATFPDFDVLIRTGNAVTDHALHRSFMHSFLFVPLLAALSALPFLALKRFRPAWKPILLAAFLATLSHPLLDALTSYGTQLLWPFSHHRFALDIIAVVDLPYTALLLLGLLLAWRKHYPQLPGITLALSSLYLAFAALQHHHAVNAQQQLLALRGHTHAANPRVLPEIGAPLNYRSLYIQNNRIYADALRIPLFSRPLLRQGTNTPLAQTPTDLPPTELDDIRTFSWFADGFIAPDPLHPNVLADMRYTDTLNGFDAIWGIRLSPNAPPIWELFPDRRAASHIWNDLTHPRGYLPLGPVSSVAP
ncbi:MAG: metal-dependent hydrolase [Phycisphaerae bacterium]